MTALPVSRSGKEAVDIACEAARKAGEVLKTHFQEQRQVQYKGRANIVTDVDLKAENAIVSFIQDEYPDHNIISEESDPINRESDYTWVLDPLDGTNNYSFGIPFFATVIAFKSSEDVMVGIIYDPLRDELFAAERGKGARLNGNVISVTKKTKVQDSLIGLDLGYVEENGRHLLKFIADLWPRMYAFRLMGSAALGMAYASCGRLDLYFHALVYPWELACGQLLVTEAGGVISDWEGRPVSYGESSIIASNRAIHADFLRMIRETTQHI
ncbi:MAG: inositol monophosphatase [Dehalococcoidia bacterium]|nr:MAG: inositol monophosphatase [Dehalococcoidia bacterium]